MATIRQQQFIGRKQEIELLQVVLTAVELPFNFLYLFGTGGVGKTALLHNFAALCKSQGIESFWVDARNVNPTPEEFQDALNVALSISDSDDPIKFLATQTERCVLFIDTFEMLGGMSSWFSDVLIPQVSLNVLIVVAGRQSPADAWSLDDAWQEVFHAIPILNFTPGESSMYLSQRGVPAEIHSSAFQFTYGHPLALSLIADLYLQSPNTRDDGSLFTHEVSPPEVVQILLKRFLCEAPSDVERSALELCSLVRGTNEVLLKEVLFPDTTDSILPASFNASNPHIIFNWLRQLSFIDSGPSGLFPHDIARESLLADLRWRNPDWYVELHRRVRLYYTRQLQQNTNPGMQKRFLHDCIFLHRDNEIIRNTFTWRDIPAISATSLQPGDEAAIAVMIAMHEGEQSAEIAEHWIKKQPEATLVLRDTNKTKEPVAFLTMLELHKASPEDIDRDPATSAAWKYVQHHAPLRPEDGVTYLRFWMTAETYQKPSPLQSLLIVHALHHFLIRGKRLAYTFFCCRHSADWQSIFQYAGIPPLPAGFVTGGDTYTVFGHDWRSTPIMEWVARMAEKEVDAVGVYRAQKGAPMPVDNTLPVALLVVLSESEFSLAVRDALRDINKIEILRHNPLMRTHIAGSPSESDNTKASTLVSTLQRAVESLNTPDIRSQRGFRALHHTYIQPHISQEEAAKALDVPFSTYRRHLAEGTAAIVAKLWQLETSKSI